MTSCNGDCVFESEASLDLVQYENVDFLREFNEECSPIPSNEKQEEDTTGQKRKRRKKRVLTGVSRQRRAANARERRRIQGVNRAFVNLKNTLPLPHVDISKIEILRLAVKWIDHLGTLLKDYEERKDLLNMKQMETSRPNEFINVTGENVAPVKHDCLYHQFPDLKNTLWEDCIGLKGRWLSLFAARLINVTFVKLCISSAKRSNLKCEIFLADSSILIIYLLYGKLLA